MKNTIKTYAPLAILFLLSSMFVFGAFAATYYVATTGDDGNAGTLASPFLTVTKAANTVDTGDIIKILQGTYTGAVLVKKASLTFTNHSGAYACLSTALKKTIYVNGSYNSGTITNLYLKALYQTDGSGHRTTVDIEGANWPGDDTAAGNSFWLISSNYIKGMVQVTGRYNRIKSNEFDGAGIHYNAYWEQRAASHHNIIKNNNIHDYTNRGIWSMSYTSDSEFSYNTVKRITPGGAIEMCIDMDGAGNYESGHTIKFNNVSSCADRGIELENCRSCIAEKNKINTARYGISFVNYSVATSAGGNMRDPNFNTNSVARNNIILNTDEAGIRVAAAPYVSLFNNTIVGVNNTAGYWGGIAIIKVGARQSTYATVKNNIVYNAEPYALWVEDVSITGTDLANNLYKRAGSTTVIHSVNQTDYTVAAWQAVSGTDSRSLDVDPLLLSDFSIPSSSPAKDAGTALTGFADDYAGYSRPRGPAWDIGAFEFLAITSRRNKGFTFGAFGFGL